MTDDSDFKSLADLSRTPGEAEWAKGKNIGIMMDHALAMDIDLLNNGEAVMVIKPSADGKSHDVERVPMDRIVAGTNYIFLTGDKDFLGDNGDRRFARMPELGMPYGGGTDSGKTTTDPYEAFAEYARGDADLDRRMRMIDDPQMPVEAIVGDEVPDHISIERKNPHYDPIVDNLGVRIDGIEQDSVVEYCVSGGWARIGERDHHGKLIWEFDHYRARRVEGVKIEPYWRRALSRQQRRARAAKARKAK